MILPFFLKKYFWDVDFDCLDLNKNQDFIAVRLLEHGDIRALRWLFKHMGKKEIKQLVLKSRGFSPKTINFWSLIFNLNREKVQCLNKSYQKTQSRHWVY